MHATTRTILAVGGCLVIVLCSSCDPFKSCHDVNVRSVYLTAARQPEVFDAGLSSLELEDGTSTCFRNLSDQALEQEQAKLLECGQMVTGSTPWKECHDEAEATHNQAVVLNDIANAVDRQTRFDESPGGQYLILTKSILGSAQYESLIESLEALVPDMQCEVCD